MKLQKQIMPVNLTGGLDTKTDPKSMVPGSLTDLENCEIIKANQFKKRPGHVAETETPLSGSTPVNGGQCLATHNGQLLRVKDGTLYARTESSGTDGRWIEKGYVSRVDTKTIDLGSRNETAVDDFSFFHEHVELNGFAVFGYNGAIKAVDLSSNVEIASVTSSTSIERIKCTTFGDRIYIFYYSSNNLVARYFDTTGPYVFSAASTIFASSAAGSYDVSSDESIGVLVAFAANSDPNIQFKWFDTDLTQRGSPYGPQTVTASQTGSGDDIEHVKIYKGGGDEWYIVYYAGYDNTIRYLVVDDNLSVTRANTTIDSLGNNQCMIGCGHSGGAGTAGTLHVYYSLELETGGNTFQMMRANVDTSGIKSSPATIKHHCVPFSDTFIFDSNRYIFVSDLEENNPSIESRVGGTLYLYDITNDRIEAKFFENSLRFVHANEYSDTKKVASPSDGVFRVFAEIAGGDEFSFSYRLAEVDFNKTQYHYAQIGNETIFAGGVVRSYDGNTVSELNYIQQSKLVSDVNKVTSGGGLGDAIYQYAIVTQWQDANGNIVQGTPFFFTVDHTSSSSGANSTDDIRLSTVGLTDKSGVKIVLYRTEGNGSVFYRRATYDNDANLSDGYISSGAGGIDDDKSDTSLINDASDILYTNGGVLENVAPPAAERVAVFKDRLFLTKMHDKSKIWYSHAVEDGFPIRTSDSLTMNVDYRGQQVEGLGVVDDKLIAFLQNRYYYTYGDGPNTTGFGGTFAPFELASNDTGVLEGKSIVETPDGLMYRSPKGIYLIDGSLGSNYIGAQVEDNVAGQTITSAIVVPEKNRVRFTTESGDMLEYDYFFRKWYTQPGLDAYDAVFLDNDYYLLRNTGGKVFKEDGSVFADDGDDYTMKIETGWISMASLVGFQRIYSLFFVGERKDTCSFKVSVAYDYSDTYVHDTTIALDTALDDGAMGYVPFRLEVPTKIQKCQAIRVKIEEVSPSSTDEAFTLTGMGMKFGVKRGFGKIRSTQTSGVS